MNDNILAAKYDPGELEGRWYEHWERSGHFKPDPRAPGPVYSVVIPPPNITGSLHMGHALNNTIQDILVRFQRMRGRQVLWQPGTDHAGIATQNKVEQALAVEGKTRQDLGREAFVERCWEWREHYGRDIVDQLKLLGCSCDWSRERFTMDEGLSRAVRTAFKAYYDAGLIYRGARMVNWCPRCHTSISDLEVRHEDRAGHLWRITYPLEDGSGSLGVATTRPETMLGDTGVAVHPGDERYRHLIGKRIALPLTGRTIPIVADEHVDPEFGTGCVKVTPAHDFNDYEIGARHGLEMLTVIDFHGRMTSQAGSAYEGLERYDCRRRVLDDLEKAGLLEGAEDYALSAATCDRCHETIEPLVSEQWWLSMESLKKPAVEVVESGAVRFHPERWTRVYLDWMESLRDWNISRQLWWGHQLPVWYCDDCGGTVVEVETPPACPACGGALTQDADVLDTWFSSALWPLSTLGWPESPGELERFYPTAVLSTAPDIIYLWVARMIMSGLYFRNEKPFDDVYLHATILARDGRRMSKSLGTGVDPREIIDEYGTDALRFTTISLTGQGQSVRLWTERFVLGRNFANKIWNAARFLQLNLAGSRTAQTAPLSDGDLPAESVLTLEDRWIVSRVGRLAAEVTAHLEAYRFNEAAGEIYEVFWHQYCDWYLELIKPRLYGEDAADREAALRVALHALRVLLKLLHPFMPFITEELFHRLFPDSPTDLIVSPWEEGSPEPLHPEAEADIQRMQGLIDAVRAVRGEMNVPPGARVELLIRSDDDGLSALLEENSGYFANLAGVSGLRVGPGLEKPKGAAATAVGDAELFIPLLGVVDFAAEAARLEKELGKVRQGLGKIAAKLENPGFASKAPAEVVEGEREKHARLVAEARSLEEHLRQVRELL